MKSYKYRGNITTFLYLIPKKWFLAQKKELCYSRAEIVLKRDVAQ